MTGYDKAAIKALIAPSDQDITFEGYVRLVRLSYMLKLLQVKALKAKLRKKYTIKELVNNLFYWIIAKRRIRKEISKIVGHRVKQSELDATVKKIIDRNQNPFLTKGEKGSIWDDQRESWIFVIIDKICSRYGWTVEQVMKLKYRVIIELLQVSNNAEIRDKMDALSISVSAYGGTKEVIDNLKSRYMKRNIKISEKVLRENDEKELSKLRLVASGKRN